MPRIESLWGGLTLGLAATAVAMALAGGAASGAAAGPQRIDESGVPPLPPLDARQQRGHDFAVARCSGCHTVGLDDGGAQEGPAFYKLARRYTPVSLEHRFAEISVHGFGLMPATPFTAAEAEDLVAYFDTLHGN